MAEWFVARNGQQQGPVTTDALRADAQTGRVAAADLCWREGMAEWRPAGDLPELAGAFGVSLPYQQPVAGLPVCTERTLMLFGQTSVWVRLFGVLILIGAGFAMLVGSLLMLAGLLGLTSVTRHGGAGLLVLGFLYAGISVLYLVPGIYLNRYASRINALVRVRREDLLEQAVEAQKSFWKWVGVVTLISFGVGVLVFSVSVIAAVAGVAHGGPTGLSVP